MINVNVDPLPKPVVNADNFMGCPPLSVTFGNNPDSSIYHYKWSFGEGNNSSIANPNHTYTTTGNYSVKVITTNNTGCRDSASSFITVFPSPAADFNIMNPGHKVYAEYQDVSLLNLSQDASFYSWDFGNGDTSVEVSPSMSQR